MQLPVVSAEMCCMENGTVGNKNDLILTSVGTISEMVQLHR